jgi:hypothetical protein
MRYFHSNKNFNQYKPPESFWNRFKKNWRKKEIRPTIIETNDILSNPFKKAPYQQKNYKKILINGLIITIFLAWISLIFTLPYFKITKIQIIGTKISQAKEVENYIKYGDYFKDGLISNQNYFLFPKDTLSNKIKDQFLYEQTEIQKTFPDTIKVIVTEKPPSIIYDDNGQILILDADGKLIKKTEFSYGQIIYDSLSSSTSSTLNQYNDQLKAYQNVKAEYGDFPIIKDYKIGGAAKDKYLSKNLIQATINWQKYLKDQGIGQVTLFNIDETDFNLKITLDKPFYVLTNTKNDQDAQMRNLKIILNTNHPTNYIDLRFGERIYWK